MMKFNFDVTVSGNRLIEIPICHYDYVNITNNTGFDFSLFNGNSNQIIDLIGFIPPYTVLSLPHSKLVNTVNVVWNGLSTFTSQRCSLYYTIDSLGWGGNLNPPALAPAVIFSPHIFEGIRPSRQPEVFNLALPITNTEYLISLGFTSNFTCYLEENDVPYRVSYIAGRVAGLIRPYILLPAGVRYSETNIQEFITLHVAVGVVPRNFTVIKWS
ncbi:MAG: hypothetical protein DDT42_01115 [candidate division WS2 bacterium]|uniref:Uncharacterized protein n=1 Tax=Psychracetigena formicireducens TaxID=2986056 RepID=A0A9E2F6D2_PSYF1|nr:hypothetical protein [Candidatus Psychracetigena formicireducens]